MMQVAGTAVDAAQSVTVTGRNVGIAAGGILGGVLLGTLGSASQVWTAVLLIGIALAVVIAGWQNTFPPSSN